LNKSCFTKAIDNLDWLPAYQGIVWAEQEVVPQLPPMDGVTWKEIFIEQEDL
jgi:hypothetical protein